MASESSGKLSNPGLLNNALKGIAALIELLSDLCRPQSGVLLLRSLLRHQNLQCHSFVSDNENFLSHLAFSGSMSKSSGPTVSNQRLRTVDEHLYAGYKHLATVPFSCVTEPPLNLLFREVFYLHESSKSVRARLILRITPQNGVLFVIDNKTGKILCFETWLWIKYNYLFFVLRLAQGIESIPLTLKY